VKGVLACPASCVEYCAAESAFAGQAQYRGLWCSNIPRGRAIDVRRIPGLARPPLVTGRSPPAVRLFGSDSWLGHRGVFPATGVAPDCPMRASLDPVERQRSAPRGENRRAVAGAAGRKSDPQVDYVQEPKGLAGSKASLLSWLLPEARHRRPRGTPVCGALRDEHDREPSFGMFPIWVASAEVCCCLSLREKLPWSRMRGAHE
jgi:hypothetical protein